MIPRRASPLVPCCLRCSLLASNGYPLAFVSSRRQYASRRAPTIRRAEAQARRGREPPTHPSKPLPSGDNHRGRAIVIPPVAFLKGAKKLGLLRSGVPDTLRFLEAFVALGPKPVLSRVRRLCEEHRIALSDLPYIPVALLLTSLRNAAYYPLCRRVLFTAIDLHLPLATYFLIAITLQLEEASAVRKLSRPDFAPALADLQRRVASGSDKRALVLWGRVLLVQGMKKEAMSVFEKAVKLDETESKKPPTDPNTQEQTSAEAEQQTSPTEDAQTKSVEESDDIDDRVIVGASMALAYMHLGRYHLQQEKEREAETHFRVAAERYDHAGAWLQLARSLGLPAPARPLSLSSLTFSQNEKLREGYLLAAARHGKVEAARQLAHLYRARSQLPASQDESERNEVERATRQLEDRMWAREWSDLVEAATLTGGGGGGGGDGGGGGADGEDDDAHFAGISLLGKRA